MSNVSVTVVLLGASQLQQYLFRNLPGKYSKYHLAAAQKIIGGASVIIRKNIAKCTNRGLTKGNDPKGAGILTSVQSHLLISDAGTRVVIEDQFTTGNAAAMLFLDKSTLLLRQNARFELRRNSQKKLGSIALVEQGSAELVLAKEQRLIEFKVDGATLIVENNTALSGAGITSSGSSQVVFTKSSNIVFRNNKATNRGGAIDLIGNGYLEMNGRITKNGDYSLQFLNNAVNGNDASCSGGGAIGIGPSSHVLMKGRSLFRGNSAPHSIGGAIIAWTSSSSNTKFDLLPSLKNHQKSAIVFDEVTNLHQSVYFFPL